ncbi:MAG TPA: transposase family protein, partial [Abditibacteriaceae bacterium]|nr:transposase family protein [Abditibacteriaceae bacterium]
MRYEEIKDRSPADFQRLTGVKPQVFEQMLKAVQKHIRSFGRPCKLCLADHLLLTLMYWREYRTMFHIARTYGVSEPTVHRTIGKIETALLACGQFRLPGKKALLDPEMQWQVVLVDATETPVERPQKNRENTIAARRSATPS